MAITQVGSIQSILSTLGTPGNTTISYSGDALALGIGTPTLANFPSKDFANFVVMSSGQVTSITNANTAGNQGTDLGSTGTPGDKATLKLTIPVPKSTDGTLYDGIGFDFTFLSEEYPEFVGSNFNDYFSVNLNGTEIALDTSGKPISVNNNFFSGALSPTGTFFDGQTPPLHIQSKLPAGSTSVELTLEIADIGDGRYDSAAFFNNLSFTKAQTVYIAFDGGEAVIGHGPAKGQKITLPGLASSVATTAYKQSVIDTLNNTVFGDYNITFTATKPTSGEYATILVGGTGAKAAVPRDMYLLKTEAYTAPGFTGLAEQIDVGNKDLSDLAIILTENFSEGTSPPATSLAQTIGHEMGHLLGLYHVNDASQIMYYAKNNALTIGGESTLREYSSNKQNAQLELAKSLGLKSGATLADVSTSASETLKKQGILGFDNLQMPLYDAQIAILSEDGPSVYQEVGTIAPNTHRKFALPMAGTSNVMFLAKSSQNGDYDVFSQGSNSSDLMVTFGADSAKLNFNLVKVQNNSVTSQIGSVAAQVDTTTVYVTPLSVSDLTSKPTSQTLQSLVDFDGVNLGSASNWVIKGETDVQGDGDKEIVLFNKSIGRWATLGPDTNETIDLVNHSWEGDTRVVGIYTDPLVASGSVTKGSANDSQARFINDLQIDNIAKILDSGDYNADDFQEIYFGLADKSAVLRAVMHKDGNIAYANYQSSAELSAYLTGNGFDTAYFSGWL